MDTRNTLDSNDCLLSAKVFKRDVQISFSKIGRPPERRDHTRSEIKVFSARSSKRLRHMVRNSDDLLKAFITLTYPAEFPCDGKETKRHLNAFLQYLRRLHIKYIWVEEFQKRGAPHYHIMVTGYIPKDELSERWYQIVGSGDERHLRAGTQIACIRSKKQLYGYLSNYVKKLEQKIVPEGFENVGRFWGASRKLLIFTIHHLRGSHRMLTRSIRLIRRWYKAHLRQWGIKWKWKGKGFTALDGTGLIINLISGQR